MKKLLAIITVFALLFSFVACGKDADNSATTSPATGDVTDAGETMTNESFESKTDGETESATESSAELIMPSDDPSTWTKEQIVEFYKAAAINSNSQKSVEKKAITELVVNDGDGFIGTLVEMVTPLLVSALEDSETEFDGVTGKPESIVPEDIQYAKAYKSGDYIVVEMTMKEQVDDAHGDRYSGTVGHSISVVGDLAVVEEALPQLEMRFDEAKFSLRYANPNLKVKINKDGVIEKGTWSYIIDIDIENLYVGGRRLPLSATVKSAYGTVDYAVTVGGGF